MTREELDFIREYQIEPVAKCRVCGKETWGLYDMGEPCDNPKCSGGRFLAIVDQEAQNELAGMLMRDGYDLDEMICRTCGALYDGGQCCTYCGDHNPTDDPEEEFGG